MSDKRNINIQDRGWDDMRSVLDNEIPEKEKKRRFGFWFLFGSATIATAFFVGLFTFPSLMSESKIVKSQSETFVNTINAKETSNPSVNNETESFTEDQSSNQPKESDINTSSLNNDKVAEKATLTTKNVHLNQSSNQNDLFKEQNSESTTIVSGRVNLIPSIKNQSTQISDNQLITSSEISAGNEILTNHEKQIGTNKELEKVEELDENDLKHEERSILQSVLELPFITPTLDIQIDKRVDLNKPIIASNNQYSLSPYLFAVGNYQSNINGYGYGIGAGLSYGSKDFQVYIESGYIKSKFDSGTLAQDFAADLNISVYEVESPDGTSNEINATSFDLRVINFSQLTRSTSEIKIDLGIRRKLFKKMNLDIGISYSKLLKASNKSLFIEYGNALNFPELTEKESGVSSSELYNGGAYSSYDVVPHIGVEYSILSNFHLGFSYYHGLRNLISNTELDRISSISANDEIFRRNISAKVRFEF